MADGKITRGSGLLETFLSIKRMKKADKLINNFIKNGTILDIGCGCYPIFLINSNFKEKYGIDQNIKDRQIESKNLKLLTFNISIDSQLPFPNNYFDVITLLAVIEHLDYIQLTHILKECYSKLKKNGIIIITTPAKWSSPILKLMSKISLISPEEINGHICSFTIKNIFNLLIKVNFRRKNIHKGYFEFFLNQWICAKK